MLRQVILKFESKQLGLSNLLDHSDAGWSSLVARRAHNPKVVGSNPAPATNSTFKLLISFKINIITLFAIMIASKKIQF